LHRDLIQAALDGRCKPCRRQTFDRPERPHHHLKVAASPNELLLRKTPLDERYWQNTQWIMVHFSRDGVVAISIDRLHCRTESPYQHEGGMKQRFTSQTA
jgi:hypothetical protein